MRKVMGIHLEILYFHSWRSLRQSESAGTLKRMDRALPTQTPSSVHIGKSTSELSSNKGKPSAWVAGLTWSMEEHTLPGSWHYRGICRWTERTFTLKSNRQWDSLHLILAKFAAIICALDELYKIFSWLRDHFNVSQQIWNYSPWMHHKNH